MNQTNYVDDMMSDFSEEGLTQDLRDVLYEDAQFLSDLNVSNERQRNLAFYLDYFCDDICKEFGYNIKDIKPVIVRSFNYLKDTKDVDLTKIRAAILKSLRELNRKKVAYPNTTGTNESNIRPKADLSKWVSSLSQIYMAMKNGEGRESAFKRITEGWDSMSKHDFEAWARYYEKGDHEKYNVKSASDNSQFLPVSFLDEGFEPKQPVIEKPVEQPTVEQPVQKRNKTPEDVKKSLLSRLNSAERLLYNFVHVWPDNVYNRLHQGLSDLKREIAMMRSASSMSDRIIRTASLWENAGFLEGAEELRKIAQPPDDITSEIEKALTGREKPKAAPTAPEVPEMPGAEMPMPGTEMPEMPMPGTEAPLEELGMPPATEKMPAAEEPGAIPAGVEESLPPMEEPPGGSEKKGIPKNNPYSGATVQDVLEILEPLSQKLREREFIRDLSKVDMMLDALNIASHFTELGEAQAKALELNIYVGTRVEKIVSKLKGGLKEEGKEDKEKEKTPPNIEMDELGKRPEETAFEVVEEGGPPPEMPMPEMPAPEASPKKPVPEPPKPGK
jgi:hypothetical protein